MFHEKLSSSYRRWLFGWRTAAWLAHCRLADALLLGRRAAAWVGALLLGLAHYCLTGVVHCCLASVLQRGSARGGAGSLLQSAQCGVAVALASDYSVGASSCSKRSRV